MTTTHQKGQKRLAAAMNDRRLELNLRWKDVADRAQITAETLRQIRHGSTEMRDTTRARVEDALQWTRGSILHILDGGTPTPSIESPDDDPLTTPEEDTTPPPPADRPPVGTGYISGPPLLHPHEEMWWKPTPPDWPGKPGIDYTYRWTNPSPGEGPESVQSSKAMSLDRPFGDVIGWFRYWMRETHGVSDGDDG